MARAPWWDEGLFSDVALRFKTLGHLGSSVLATAGYVTLPGVHQYTYWQMPLYLVTLGAWLKLLPFNIEDVRLFSVFWGLVYISAWLVFVRYLSGSRQLALLTAAVVALDYSLINAASDGRMDMMCAALGQAALACYAWLRGRDTTLALKVAAWFGAAALFCHPMGAVMNLFLAIVVLRDWQTLRWPSCLLAAGPYVLGGALCAIYDLQAPNIYRVQSIANSSYRISTRYQILHHLMFDFTQRYLYPYSIFEHGLNRLKIFCLLFGLAGLTALLVSRRLRGLTISRVLLTLSLVSYVSLAALDNQTLPVYLIYSLPYVTACGAVWLFYAKSGGWQRKAGYALLAAYFVATLGAFSEKILKNDNRRLYEPAIAAIEASRAHGGLVMGGSELGFALGFDQSKLVDDRYLGYFSAKEPEVYVANYYYGEFAPAHLHRAWEWSRKELAEHYHVVYKNSAYEVYRRNHDAGTTLSAIR